MQYVVGFNSALGYGFQTHKFDRVLKTKGPPKRLAAIQYTSYIYLDIITLKQTFNNTPPYKIDKVCFVQARAKFARVNVCASSTVLLVRGEDVSRKKNAS